MSFHDTVIYGSEVNNLGSFHFAFCIFIFVGSIVEKKMNVTVGVICFHL